MDEIDIAQGINEEILADALSDHFRRGTSGISKMYCADCGEPIPQARRKAVRGCTRCVMCQAEFEQQELLSHWRGV